MQHVIEMVLHCSLLTRTWVQAKYEDAQSTIRHLRMQLDSQRAERTALASAIYATPTAMSDHVSQTSNNNVTSSMQSLMTSRSVTADTQGQSHLRPQMTSHGGHIQVANLSGWSGHHAVPTTGYVSENQRWKEGERETRETSADNTTFCFLTVHACMQTQRHLLLSREPAGIKHLAAARSRGPVLALHLRRRHLAAAPVRLGRDC